MLQRVAATCLSFGLACVGCAGPDEPLRVRVGTDVDAGSLDPRLMRDTTAYRVCDLVYDGLVRLDRALEPQPALATSWESTSPTQWVFHLREGVRFHDGSKLTAEDVVHTFETLLDPSFGAPLRSLYAPITRIEAVDAHTVALSLKDPYAPLLRYLDVGIVPASGDSSGRPVVGTGPYRLKQWDRGNRIQLEAHAGFWGGAPGVPEVEFLVVPDNTARAQAFEAGDLDVIQSPLAPRDIARLSDDPRFVAHAERGLAITYLNFNTSRPPFDDVRVRRAVSMLIDQDTILDQIYEGVDEKASSVLLEGGGEARQPSYDPEAARALLAEVGGSLSFEIGTHSEDINRVQTVEYLQNVLGRFGVEARVRVSDWASFSVRRDAGDFDAILLGWTQLVDPDRGTFDQFHSGGGLNWGGYRNTAVDALLEKGRHTLDREERRRTYEAVAEILASEVPYYVLSYQSYHLFHAARLSGLAPDRRGFLRGLVGMTLATR